MPMNNAPSWLAPKINPHPYTGRVDDLRAELAASKRETERLRACCEAALERVELLDGFEAEAILREALRR